MSVTSVEKDPEALTMGFLSLASPKKRSPVPSTTGKTTNRSSSTRSCSISARPS